MVEVNGHRLVTHAEGMSIEKVAALAGNAETLESFIEKGPDLVSNTLLPDRSIFQVY